MDLLAVGYDDITKSERDLIIALLRIKEAEYLQEIARMKLRIHGPRSPSWTEYVAAVSKASMARTLAFQLERGDHRRQT